MLNHLHHQVIFNGLAPIAQPVEAADLKSVQSRFESEWGHLSPYNLIVTCKNR